MGSHYPYILKKEIICCQQNQIKAISCDTNAYQEEMNSLRQTSITTTTQRA